MSGNKYRIVTKTITRADKNSCKTWYFAKKEDFLTEEGFKENIMQPILDFFGDDIESVYGQFRDVIFAGSSYTSINVLVRLKSDSINVYRVADMKAKLGTCMICPIAREENNDIIHKFFSRRFNGYDIYIVDVNPVDEYIEKMSGHKLSEINKIF